ncbi:MAG: hypothetical protein LBH66_04105 [Oscillospiraceae bacterium]|nr:hypothetical protein [Oscillospiraceae bacterium]
MPRTALPAGVVSGVDELTLIPSFIQLSNQLLAREDALNGLLEAERDKLELASPGPSGSTGPMYYPDSQGRTPSFDDLLALTESAGDMVNALADMACAQSCRFWWTACLEKEMFG